MTDTTRARRAYDSPVRRQRAAETRERILTAGAELLHGFPIWNWSALTVRAVAARAGVNERTVYRHFETERALRDAVLVRLEEESGIAVDDGLTLDDVAAVTARMFEYVSSFPVAPRVVRDDTVAAANARQRAALLAALAPHTAEWSDLERTLAAAVLDVLWSTVSYERLVTDWELDPEEAIRGLTWTIGLVEAAVRSANPPRATMPGTGHDEGDA
jgi:AcrR family transcriptional regulator